MEYIFQWAMIVLGMIAVFSLIVEGVVSVIMPYFKEKKGKIK